jgi:hypothetical protein
MVLQKRYEDRGAEKCQMPSERLDATGDSTEPAIPGSGRLTGSIQDEAPLE